MDASGLSRYLPLVIYPRGRPDDAVYVGHRTEVHDQEVRPLWVPRVQAASSGTVDAVELAVGHLRRLGLRASRVGVESAFLPADADAALRAALPDSTVADAIEVLERLRARKSPEELALLRAASEGVVESMVAVISSHGAGSTKRELAEALRREETNRGLVFEYCLITAGSSHNRAPSDQRWRQGEVLSLDSGASYQGYVGDLARMAVLGEPDAELEDLLAEVDAIQRAAMAPIAAGTIGSEIYAAANPLVDRSTFRKWLHFVAHGMGLVSHEAPRLTSNGPVPYRGVDADRPLESRMVLSIETTMLHPTRGFIKLEDAVAVTDNGFEIFGGGARGWNTGMSLR
jgi:Xaa-Pro aminopeptidase